MNRHGITINLTSDLAMDRDRNTTSLPDSARDARTGEAQ